MCSLATLWLYSHTSRQYLGIDMHAADYHVSLFIRSGTFTMTTMDSDQLWLNYWYWHTNDEIWTATTQFWGETSWRFNQHENLIEFPLWLAVVSCLASVLLLLYAPKLRVHRAGACHHCGYDLRGNPECRHCPECGTVVATQPVPAKARPTVTRPGQTLAR